MAETWATSSLDLHVDLEVTRVRASLEAALRTTVRRLEPGARLPSSRALAQDLGIARNTVADAYGQLVAEGWLEARQGSGTRVAERAPAAAPAADTREPARPPRYDLRPGHPDVTSFPRTAWLRAARRALAVAPPHALGYTDPRGLPELRAALATYLARARGVEAAPERIVVVTGFTQGLALLARVLRDRGADTVAVEEHGHRLHREVLGGFALQDLPIDEHGAATPTQADAALLTPAHQFPLGMALAPHRRRAAIATGALLIEDDYDGEFRYDRQPVGAMQALAPDRVVYAGTASKVLAPGLRLGWFVVPAALVETVREEKLLADQGSPRIEQLAFAAFLEGGHLDRHLRGMRIRYRDRRNRMVDALAAELPAAVVRGIAAGLHVTVELSPDDDEAAVCREARRRGIALSSMGDYRPPPTDLPPTLILGYSQMTGGRIADGVRELAAAVRTARA